MKDFVHLHLHTEYSLLDGASRISDLIPRVAELSQSAVCITDHGNMYGSYKFLKTVESHNDSVKEYNAKPENKDSQRREIKGIVGCEFYVAPDLHIKAGRPDNSHLILLAKNMTGYKNLAKLNSIAFIDGFYYKPRIDYKTLKQYSEGIICLSACIFGDIPKLILARRYDEAEELALQLKETFKDDFYFEIQNHGIEDELEVKIKLREMGKKLGIKLVATNDVHYISKQDAEMQDVLMCISMKKTIDDPTRMKYNTDELYLKSREEMEQAFVGFEDALDNTVEIAQKCEQINLKKQNFIPGYTPPDNLSPREYLRKLTEAGINKRYKVVTDEVKKRMEYELQLIDKMGFNEYFLIVWDFINFSENHGINVGPGRGSGAGSIVAYAVGITKVEPLKYNLLFERFINPERITMPDFDIDFPPDRCEEVIAYVTEKYGEDRVCGIVTFGKLKAKAAIKDVARVFRMPFSEVNNITKNIDVKNIFNSEKLQFVFGLADPNKKMNDESFQAKYNSDLKLYNPELKELYLRDENVRKVVDLSIKLENMPRNCSQHAAGVVICDRPLADSIPLCKNGDKVTTQFDMIEVEKLGFLKMDFLRLDTLSDIKGTLDIIKEERGEDLDLYSLDYSDPKVFELIASGDTDAIFQLESGGFKKFMKELKPNCLEDIIAGVALFRPGPMDSIPKYVENKHNPEKVVYALPCLKKILEPTYGIIVYQEQVMQIVQEMAGYSLGQADLVRRMMSKKDMVKMIEEREVFIHGRLDKPDKKGIEGALKRGATIEVANQIFDQMITFADYAFNKNHAAPYAFLTYQTAYLKCYYPIEFLVGVLNNRLSKQDDISKYVMYAKSKNYPVYAPDINKSKTLFSVENGGIRFGLGALKNMGIQISENILEDRKERGEYKDIVDLITRLNKYGLNKKGIESLILSGALDCFGRTRRDLMAVYETISQRVTTDKKAQQNGQTSIFDTLLTVDETVNKIDYPNLKEYPDNIKLKLEKEIVGVYVSGHPLDKYLAKFSEYNFSSLMLESAKGDDDDENFDIERDTTLEDGMQVVFGGIISEIKKIYTKRDNKEMALLKVEDMYGVTDVMLFPKIYAKYRQNLELDAMATFAGKLSVRYGENPTVMLETLQLWEEHTTSPDGQSEKKIEDRVEDAKTLYLLLDTTNEELKNSVLEILSNHAGENKVVIQCSQTKQLFKGTPVQFNNLVEYELLAFLPQQNIKFK